MDNLKLLARGNSKLFKTIFCWSITPIVSCLNCEQCKKHCYARFPYAFYPATKKAWDRNFELAKSGEFVQLVIDQIKVARSCKTVRIHVAGDFFSQEYINQWQEIASQFPGINFYSYSKVFNLFDFSKLVSLPNVNIINSIAFDGGINFGKRERVDFLKLNGYIECPAVEGDVACGKDCSLCITNEKVCFLQHK